MCRRSVKSNAAVTVGLHLFSIHYKASSQDPNLLGSDLLFLTPPRRKQCIACGGFLASPLPSSRIFLPQVLMPPPACSPLHMCLSLSGCQPPLLAGSSQKAKITGMIFSSRTNPPLFSSLDIKILPVCVRIVCTAESLIFFALQQKSSRKTAAQKAD